MTTPFAITAVLLADANWLKIIFFLVVFVIWIINNVLAEKNKKAKRPTPRPVDRPELDAAGNQRAGAGQANAPQLNSEIEEFLQRANRKRQEKAQRKAKATSKPAAAPAPPKPAAPERKRLVESLRGSGQSASGERTSAGSPAYIAPDLAKYDDGPSRLLDNDILKNDANRQAHFQQAFDHQVGRLADTSLGAAKPGVAGASAATGGKAPEPTTAAAAKIPLAALLANPQNLQQAVLMQEILRRPEERWQ